MVSRSSPRETISFLPIIVLAIVFGLSSDYQVFVVSRMKEELTRTDDALDAVRSGVGVFLDAFVVRLTLIPAIMSILGNRMWAHSKWFAKYVPDVDIEGTKLEVGESPGQLAASR